VWSPSRILLHEAGLTWADARKQGYRSAFKVTVLREVKPPKKRPATTRFHHADVGKVGEAAGPIPPGKLRGMTGIKKKKKKKKKKRP
jgi:hypothetical protein